MNKKSPKGRVVVISGGSSGIGYAVADVLLDRGAIVCLIARDENMLKNAAQALRRKHPGASVFYYSCDVSNYEHLQATVQMIANDATRIDWIINNAGIAETGRIESQPISKMRAAMDTNYWGYVYLTLAAMPYLMNSSGAAIAFVSSVAGYVGLFGYSHYAPSKFAVTGLAECLRMEFQDYGIQVTVVYPPDTNTPMHERERLQTLPECAALSANAKVVSADYVAVQLANGIQNGRYEVFCNGQSKAIRILRVLAPQLFFALVDGMVHRSRIRRLQRRAGVNLPSDGDLRVL
jgi:3-dehydrosphinganine reductase